jgi:hypothetical protein
MTGLENRDYGRRDPSRWPRGTLSAKVGPNVADKRRSPVGIVHSRAQATKFSLVFYIIYDVW